MFTCPNCDSKLSRVDSTIGRFWSCPECNGRVVNLPVLQKAFPKRFISQLWRDARSTSDVGQRSCPACGRRMKVVSLTGAGNPLYLDVCITCYFIWFDPKEFEQVPKTEHDIPVPQESSSATKVALAKAQVAILQESRKEEWEPSAFPDNWWEMLPAVFGFPVEYNDQMLAGRPIITWVLSVLMAVLFLLTASNLSTIINQWGLIPAELYRHYGATIITSFLLHGGFLHLLGNLYFFLLFGDNVEEDMSWRKYMLLIASAALLGDAFHIMADPRSNIPVVGASGGISGILVYYALKFPKARIGMFLFYRWYRIPVGIMLFLWLLLQIFVALQQLSGFGNVSALGHLGGAFAGYLFWLHSRLHTEEAHAIEHGLE